MHTGTNGTTVLNDYCYPFKGNSLLPFAAGSAILWQSMALVNGMPHAVCTVHTLTLLLAGQDICYGVLKWSTRLKLKYPFILWAPGGPNKEYAYTGSVMLLWCWQVGTC